MLARLLAAAVVALGVSSAHAQYADPNLQNLLAGLMNGGEVTLITPLTTGMLQVTSFRPSVRLDAAETAAYVDRAREELAALGVAQPSAEQIARMLAGGPLDVTMGRVWAQGLLSVTRVPEASPFTRFWKLASPPAKAMSCGARRCTSSAGETWVGAGSVCVCTAWASALVLRARAATRRSDLMAVTSEVGPAADRRRLSW